MDILAPEKDDGILSRIFARILGYVQEHRLKTAAFIVSSAGAFCVASVDYGVQVIGFELWICSNTAWILIGIEESDYPLLFTFVVYFVFNLLGTMARLGWC